MAKWRLPEFLNSLTALGQAPGEKVAGDVEDDSDLKLADRPLDRSILWLPGGWGEFQYGPPRKHDPRRAYAETRVVVELKPRDATAGERDLVLDARVRLLPRKADADPVIVIDALELVGGEPSLPLQAANEPVARGSGAR